MNLIPCNRHIHVEPYEEITEKNDILLPEEYLKKKKDKQYGLWKVISVPDNLSLNININSIIIVENISIKELEISNQKFHLVQENYVLAIVKQF